MKTRLRSFFLVYFNLILLTSITAQSETHNFTTYDTTISWVGGITWTLRISRPVNYFTPNHPDTASRPIIWTTPGQGQMGTDTSKLSVFGPHYWMKHGWDGGVVLGNGTHYPIIITAISSNTWMTGRESSELVARIYYKFHPKAIHAAGLSQGAFSLSASLLYPNTTYRDTSSFKIKSLVCLQGVSSEVTGGNIQPDAGWGRWAKQFGGKFFGLEGSTDYREVWRISEAMEDSVAGSAYFAYENIGGGAHCCWNDMYNPSRNNWQNVAPFGPNVTTGSHPNTPGTYKIGSNIFQWMLRQGDTTLVDNSSITNQPPVASAGTDQTITLPTNTITLNASGSTDSDGTIVSYAWTKISGGNATISSPSNSTTTVTGLSQGVYVFRVTVTDDDGDTGTDDVTVTVNTNNSGKHISKIAVTEYRVGWVSSDSNIYSYINNGIAKWDIGSRKVVDASAGGFSQLLILDDNGYVWRTVTGGSTIPVRIETDTTGLPFNGNIAVYGYYYTYISIRSDSSLWYWGADNYNLYSGTDTIKKPIRISPEGMKVKKVAMGGLNIIVLLTNGEVWQWSKNGSLTPTKRTIPRPAIDIFSGQYNINGCIIPDVTGSQTVGYPYVWGTYYGYWGGASSYSEPTSVKALWGVLVPIKEIAANANTIHYIDSLGRMFGIGDNPNGEIGNGYELVNKYQYPTPYSWSWNPNEALTGAPAIQIGAGITWKKLYKNNTISYFMFASDVNDSIYFWGRDKALASGRGYINWQEAAYPNALDVLQPLQVHPLQSKYQAYDFTLGSINAGTDQIISSATTTLAGTAVAPKLLYRGVLNNGQPDISYSIVSYEWTKLSGPSCTITSPSSSSTTVTGLTDGVYLFRLVTTDNNTGTMSDTVKVTVSAAPPANQAPTANAGADKTITLPLNTVTLNGSGSDPDGSVVSYQWSKVSGPTQGTIANPTSAQTAVNNLVQGIYNFELTVTDDDGATGKDTVKVTVNAAPPANQAPTANAGADQTITLPLNTVTLNGSGSDPDGSVVSYQWSKVSGPTQGTIANPTSAQTAVNNLVQGVYDFELTVTDDNGATGKDTVRVTVNAAPPANQAPTSNAGADQAITLPSNTVTLNGSGSDPDGSVVSYQWSKVSGPAQFTIVSGTSAQTVVNNLVQGVYEFELTVTDDDGATATDVVQIIVNQPPVANAGPDHNLTLPDNSTFIIGSGTDTDGAIVAYQWAKISGPSQFVVLSPANFQTGVTNLIEGIYQFELTVTDNRGATGKDTVRVTVNAAAPPSNQAPTANAGADKTIILPLNTVTLNGSGSDPDGSIVSYQWSKVSGPTQFTIVSGTSAQTAVNNLVQGVYEFELTVTDNHGTTDKDTVRVTVNAAPAPPNQPPTAQAGNDLVITLPVDSVNLVGNGLDADGVITAYRWRQISGPSQYNIVSSNEKDTEVKGLVQGIYIFELEVTDNGGATGRDSVRVHVKPRSESTARVYPNPAEETINIRIDAATGLSKTKIQIFTVTGMLVYETEVTRDQQLMIIPVNVSRLTKGAYFVKLNTDINKYQTITFIKN